MEVLEFVFMILCVMCFGCLFDKRTRPKSIMMKLLAILGGIVFFVAWGLWRIRDQW